MRTNHHVQGDVLCVVVDAMRKSFRRGAVAAAALCLPCAVSAAGAPIKAVAPGENVAGGADEANPIAAGHDLFLHSWRPHDPLSPGGDGLGPMFNARSCVACHNLGGVGGGGAADKNVAILGVVESARSAGFVIDGQIGQAEMIHAGLRENPGGVVLHKFSVNGGYEPWREQRVWFAIAVGSPFAFSASVLRPQDISEASVVAIERAAERGRFSSDPSKWIVEAQAIVNRVDLGGARPGQTVKVALTERNSSSLFGSGLIDDVPDEVIEAEAARQVDRPHPGPPSSIVEQWTNGELSSELMDELIMPVAGRVARLEDGKIGRFGWKAQNATLEDFSLNACAVELGLQVPTHKQAADPREASEASSSARGVDLSTEQCASLVAYLHSLPAPQQVVTPRTEKRLKAGEAIFNKTGCSDCHVRDMGPAKGIYSDLLLHNVGRRLTGPSYYGTVTGTFARTRTRRSGAPLRNDVPEIVPPSPSEWRTPPLWGCRNSGPYMHDGRSRTLVDAIVEHGGQGARAALVFQQMMATDRTLLIGFLESLEAPKSAEKVGTALMHDGRRAHAASAQRPPAHVVSAQKPPAHKQPPAKP